MHTATVSQALIILTPRLTERLAAVTDAQRELRRQGFRVTSQELNTDSTRRPRLRLDHGSETLREQLTSVVITRAEIGRLVIGRFREVDVCYVEARS